MSTSSRTIFAVLMIGGALVAAAASPGAASGGDAANADYVGTWITWWDVEGEPSPCRRLIVAPEDGSTLDGMWTAPGWNGLVHGTVRQTGDGAIWEGEWRDAGGNGGFRFVLGAPGAPANQLRGTSAGGESGRALAWNGVREIPGVTPRVPCTWQE